MTLDIVIVLGGQSAANEKNEVRCGFSPEKPCRPLSIEGKAASFMGAERQLENTNCRSKNMERYCPIIFSHPAE